MARGWALGARFPSSHLPRRKAWEPRRQCRRHPPSTWPPPPRQRCPRSGCSPTLGLSKSRRTRPCQTARTFPVTVRGVAIPHRRASFIVRFAQRVSAGAWARRGRLRVRTPTSRVASLPTPSSLTMVPSLISTVVGSAFAAASSFLSASSALASASALSVLGFCAAEMARAWESRSRPTNQSRVASPAHVRRHAPWPQARPRWLPAQPPSCFPRSASSSRTLRPFRPCSRS